MADSVFSDFTQQYALSKTLRFELKPVGNTLENMKKHQRYDPRLETFLEDQDIEDAYQKLKSEFDKLHEEFITGSLESALAKSIEFSRYLENFKKKGNISDENFKKEEKELRKKIGKTYIEAGEQWKKKYSRYKWKKGSSKANGPAILESPDMLQLIKDLNVGDEEIKRMIDETFKGFFSYLGGFNQNRGNYYMTNEEKATAIATRIVHENLPKFCDNLLQFETKERKNEYLGVYEYLKNQNKTTQIKDAKSGEVIEATSIEARVFEISHFSSCLSQKEIEEYNRLIGHYNFLINLYNQSRGTEEKTLKKSERSSKRLPKFKTLYKQIGCGKKDPIFFTLTHYTKVEANENKEKFQKPYSVEQILEQAKNAGEKYFQKDYSEEINTVPAFLKYILAKESFEGVYWSKAALNSISNRYFDNYHDLKDRLREAKVFESAKGSEDQVKIPEAIELEGLFNVLDKTKDWKQENVLFKSTLIRELDQTEQNKETNEKNRKRRDIIEEEEKPSSALLKLIFLDINEHIDAFLKMSKNGLGLTEYKSDKSKEKIKEYMEHALSITQILKYFLVKESKAKGLDSEISNALKAILFEAGLEGGIEVNWFKWFDALRNFLTKKPQDDAKRNKLKLNFGKGTLLKGWGETGKAKKAQYHGYLLRKEDRYYLGITTYDQYLSEATFPEILANENEDYYQKLSYKKLDWGKNIVGGKVYPAYTKKLLGEEKSFKEHKSLISEAQHVEFLIALIEEKYLEKYPELKPLLDQSFKTVKELKDFFNAMNVGGMEFIKIKSNRIKEGSLRKGSKNYPFFLFEIANKDWGQKSNGNKNLHTMYWESLFSDYNLREEIFDLGGFAQIFYRKQAIKSKKLKAGYEKKPWIIVNKRFTENNQLAQHQNGLSYEDGKSFFFHCPIKINYRAKSYSAPKYALSEINKVVNDRLSLIRPLHFLGIDRGEKHLAYYCLIDQSGNIVGQGTLNLPFTDREGQPRSIRKEKYFYNKQKEKWGKEEVDCWDYNDLLAALASNRDMARKNWKTIGTIKELKEGYISQVVRKIADLATVGDNPAFIVLEDLNTGFKRGRQKIEKSVYQKFELALAEKLNFLVDKKAETGTLGSVMNALQLTPPVNNYGDIENRKQVGIMLYTRANYTSQTDPVTGWRKTIYIKAGSEDFIKAQIIGREKIGREEEIEAAFTDIRFKDGDYIFTYIDKNTGKKWELYSSINGKNLDRFRGKRGKDKNDWNIERHDVNKILDDVFSNFDKSRSLLVQIVDEGKELVKSFQGYTAWESLRFAIELIQQIRNSGKEERDNDFILSPVRDDNGKHFDSREYWDKEKELEKLSQASLVQALPISGDANGAYNIARKGLMMNEHIKTWKQNGKPKYNSQSSDLNLFISDKEWDLYLANKDKWKEELGCFSSRKAMESNRKKKSTPSR